MEINNAKDCLTIPNIIDTETEANMQVWEKIREKRKSSWIRYSNYEGWDMKTFIPVVEPITLNLEILETSPFLKDRSNNIIKIKKIEVLRYIVYPICEAPIVKSFNSTQEEEKFLSSLEILPKGTEIKIITSA